MSIFARAVFYLFICCGMFWGMPRFALAALTEIEPNDDFESAMEISCTDTVACAAIRYNEIDHYRILVAPGDSLVAHTTSCNSADFSTFLVIYDPDEVIVAFDNSSGPGRFSLARTWCAQGGWYTVRVMFNDAFSEPDSSYNLYCDCSSPAPEAFDYCETARIVPGLPYYDEGSTVGRSDDAGVNSPDVFYYFHQPVLSDLRIEVCSEFFDARVQMLGGCIFDFMDDEQTGCLNGATLFSFGIEPGDYYIMVEGASEIEAGEYSIEIEPVYLNCPEPIQVVLFNIGGLPSLDWPDVPEAYYYLVQQSSNSGGPFQNLDTTIISFYQDPVGFAADARFYQIKTVCPWSQ